MAEREQFVIWNGSLGIAVLAALGSVETDADGRRAWLAPPWDIVGPFDLDALRSRGCIAFGECLVMSRDRWREDQVHLRREGLRKRRSMQIRVDVIGNDRAHREALDLPMGAALEPARINAAFRRRAKTAHPDAGGSNQEYRRIVEARDALLARG